MFLSRWWKLNASRSRMNGVNLMILCIHINEINMCLDVLEAEGLIDY